MEELCHYPGLPDVLEEKKYLCLFGTRRCIENFLSEKWVKSKVSIKLGLTFYRFGHTLVVTCVVDSLNSTERTNYLSYLASVFTDVVVFLNEQSEVLKNNLKASNIPNQLSRLAFNTYFNFNPKTNEFYSNAVEHENYTKVACFNECAFSDYQKKKLNQESFIEILNNFQKKFEIFHENSFEYIHQQSEILSKKFQEIEIIKADYYTIKLIFLDVNIKKNQTLSQENTKFKESVLNLLLPHGSTEGHPFEIKHSIKQMMFMTKHFDHFIERFDEKMSSVNIISFDDMMKFFEKNLYDFFKNNTMQTQQKFKEKIKNLIYEYDKKISEIETLIKYEIRNRLKELTDHRGDYLMTVKVLRYTDSRVFKTEENLEFFSNQCGKLIQMIKDGSGYIFCFQVDLISKYFIIKYIDKCNFEQIYECDKKPEIAFGSTFDSVIIINNDLKSVEKLSKTETSTFKKIYENTSIINYPNYMQKFDCLLFLNTQGEVKSFNFSKSVMTTLKVPNPALSLRICSHQEIIGVVSSQSTVFFNLKLEKLYELTSNVPDFFIVSHNENSFDVFQYFEKTMKIIKCEKNTEKTFNISPDFQEIREDIALIFSVPLASMKNFKIYSENQEEAEKTLQFYDYYQSIFPNHKVMIFDDFSESDLFQGNLNSFIKNRYFLFANVENSNLIPVFKNPEKMIKELRSTRSDLFQKILQLSDFHELEKFTEMIPGLKVISLMSNEKWLRSFNSVFKITHRVNYSEGVWASVNSLNNKFFLCLYSNFPQDLVELQKVLTYFLSVSDYLLIAPSAEIDKNLILKCLKIGKFRFPEIQSALTRVDVLRMTKSSSSFDFSDYNVSYFSQENLYAELEFLLWSFTLTKTLRPREDLLKLLKGALVSLYLDDDVSIYERLEGTANDVQLMKTFIRKNDKIFLESFQVNINKNSTRCKAVCPGCSAMCELSECNGEKPHFTRLHRVFKNKYALEKDLEVPFTCSLLCGENHCHFEPCVGVCKMTQQFKGKWKHRSQGKTFDLTPIEYSYDKIECSTWWAYRGWRLAQE